MLNTLKAQLFRGGFKIANNLLWRGRNRSVVTHDYVLAGGQVSVRCYTPDTEAPRPVMLYFHGGGFVIGDVASYDGFCRDLCQRAQIAVVSVDYRRAPESLFPAAVDDCMVALDWLVSQTQVHGLSLERVYIGGDSAGGNLAAVTTLEARERYPGLLKGQLLIYPVTDHYQSGFASYKECGKGYLLTEKQMIWFWDTYLGRSEKEAFVDPRATPLRRDDLGGQPVTLLITAELDPLRDEGRAYVEKLQAASVAVSHAEYEGCQHGFIGIMGPTKDHNRAMEDIVAWLRHLEL
ncbi:alpha/beta hydrolase [Litorivivens sp.]|uniref:alpha/beta hydrolase n=1 Tax=Litorivivens sp. TaxID=2020868 RepID=UPI00356A7829